jgi:hypothetical protein
MQGFGGDDRKRELVEKLCNRWEDNIKIDVYKITNRMYLIRYLSTFKL